jgi:ribosomal protein L37AE/L43A
MKCSDKTCGFTANIGIGGGIKFEQASGFCKKCDRIVSVTWKRDSREGPSLVSFWDALTGQVRQVFHCPKCKAPVLRVEQIEELKHCPKCGKKSLGSKRTVLYD